MDLPTDLDAWTFDTVRELVRTREFEPAEFDYKEVLNATGGNREAVNESIRRTVCAMANAGGGYILFGVQDRQIETADHAERIVGIPVGQDLAREFGQKINKRLQPDVHFDTVPRALLLPDDAQRGVFVVRIPESHRRPHMVYPPGIFYRRGAGGDAVEMDFYQVRDQMPMRRQAFLANLKWELEENIATLCTKHHGLPLPWHYWLAPTRGAIRLTTAGSGRTVQLSGKQVSQVHMAWFIAPNADNLRVLALQEAVHSGEFLIYRQHTNRLVGDSLYQMMQETLSAIRSFKGASTTLHERRAEREALYQPARERRNAVISTHDLLFLYLLHDRAQDILRLSSALLRHSIDPSAELRPPALNAVTPYDDQVAKIEAAQVTHEEVEQWVSDPLLWHWITGESAATTEQLEVAMSQNPAFMEAIGGPLDQRIQPHLPEYLRRMEADGQDAALAWMQSVLVNEDE